MKKALLLLSFLGSLLVVDSAFARNPWRECGIGGMIFNKTGWAAITLNIVWDMGTTATTSSSSTESLCEGPKSSTAKFIFESYASLETQTAVGEGEHITAMFDTLKCDGSARGPILNSVRQGLKSRMQDASYNEKSQLEKAETYYNDLMEQVEFSYAKACLT